MNENYVSAVGWLSLVCSHATAHVSEVCSLGWVCGVQERLCEGAVRPRRAERPCEGAVRPRLPCEVYLLFIFENFRQAWQKCVAKYGNARPRPKQDTSTYVLGVLVLKKKGGVFLCGINRYKSSFDVSINVYFFSKAKELTISLLIA